jgi:apolipoprotein N-acyltransferase
MHARIFPYRSFGTLPYTQYGQTATMQLASIGGIWLIEFFVA